MTQDTLLGFPAHTLPYRCGEFATLSTVSGYLPPCGKFIAVSTVTAGLCPSAKPGCYPYSIPTSRRCFYSRPLAEKMEANTRDTTVISLIRMLMEGPEVSLKGSPTVSPTTAA